MADTVTVGMVQVSVPGGSPGCPRWMGATLDHGRAVETVLSQEPFGSCERVGYDAPWIGAAQAAVEAEFAASGGPPAGGIMVLEVPRDLQYRKVLEIAARLGCDLRVWDASELVLFWGPDSATPGERWGYIDLLESQGEMILDRSR